MAFLGGLRLAIHRRGAWIPTIRFERPAGGCERPSGPRWLGTTLGGQSDGVKVAAYSRRPGSLLPSVSTSGNVGISSVWRSVSTIVAPVPRTRCQQPRMCDLGHTTVELGPWQCRWTYQTAHRSGARMDDRAPPRWPVCPSGGTPGDASNASADSQKTSDTGDYLAETLTFTVDSDGSRTSGGWKWIEQQGF